MNPKMHQLQEELKNALVFSNFFCKFATLIKRDHVTSV